MNCDAFWSCIDHLPTPWPKGWQETLDDDARVHYEGCADCQAWLAHEQAWQQVFAHVLTPRARLSVWPGVMVAIASRRSPPMSLSRELVGLSRYFVPAFAALVLALGGIELWSQLTISPIASDTSLVTSVLVAEPTTELAFLRQDADAILNQWVGVSQP